VWKYKYWSVIAYIASRLENEIRCSKKVDKRTIIIIIIIIIINT